eukprot:403375161
MKNYLSLASALLLGAVKGNNQILKVDSSGTIDKKLKESHHNSQVPKYYNDASNGVTDIQRFNSNVQPDSGHKPVYHKPAERDHSRDGQRKKSRDAAHFRKAVPSHDHDIVRTASFSPVNHKPLDIERSSAQVRFPSTQNKKEVNTQFPKVSRQEYNVNPQLAECRYCHYEGKWNMCWWMGSSWDWGNENENDGTSDHSQLTSVETDHQQWTSPDDDDSGSDMTWIQLQQCDGHHHVWVENGGRYTYTVDDGYGVVNVKSFEAKSSYQFAEDAKAPRYSNEKVPKTHKKKVHKNIETKQKDAQNATIIEKRRKSHHHHTSDDSSHHHRHHQTQ